MQAGQTKYGIGMTVSACLWLGLFPLMQFGTFSSITKDKWICMLILAGVTVVCFSVDLFCRRLSRPKLVPLIAGGLLLLWMAVSSFASPYPGRTWWIGAGRREGLCTQLCYISIFLLFCCSRVRRTPVLISAGAGLLAFLAVVLLQRAGGNPLGLYPENYSYETDPDFQGTIGNVDMCSGYLTVLVGLFFPAAADSLRNLVHAYRKKDEPVFPAANLLHKQRLLFPVVFLALVFLLAVCAWLFYTMEVRFGLLAMCVLAVWTLIRFLPKKLWLPVFLVVFAFALLFVWFWPGESISTLHELHEIMHGNIDYSFGTERIGVWIYCSKLLQEGERLLLGTGADTFVLRFNTFMSKYYQEHPGAYRLRYYYDNPHNEYLALVLNYGIPSLLFFLVLVIGGCFGRPAWRDSVLVYGIQALLSFSVCLVAPMFWVVSGMSWSAPPEMTQS